MSPSAWSFADRPAYTLASSGAKQSKSGTCIDGYLLTKEHSHKAHNLSRLHGSSFREASISAVVRRLVIVGDSRRQASSFVGKRRGTDHCPSCCALPVGVWSFRNDYKIFLEKKVISGKPTGEGGHGATGEL